MKKNQSALISLFISLCVANASAQVVTGRAVTAIGSGVTVPVAAPVGGAGRVSAPSFGVTPVSLRSFTPSIAAPEILPAPGVSGAGVALPIPMGGALPSVAAPSLVPAALPAIVVPQGAPKAAELLNMKEELSLTGQQASEMPADGVHASGAAIMDKVLGVRPVPVTADGSGLMPGASFSGSANSSRSGLTRSKGTKGSRRGMPVEDDSARDTGPDGTDGLDDLGNPARRQDDGPDTVSDEFGGDRGGSGGAFLGSPAMASDARSDFAKSKGSRRGMPVEDDSARDSGPDGTDGLDDLGNPARRQDDGPDTVSDEFGGDRGGDSGPFLGQPGDVAIQVGMLGAPTKTSGQTVDTDKPVVLIVKFSGQDGRRLMADSFLSAVDVTKRHGVQAYAAAQDGMLQQIESLGVDRFTLSDLEATPTATVRRINSAVFRVSSSRAQEFVAFMASQGHQVYDNDSRKIIKPIPVTPENVDPAAPSAVTLDETLKIVRAGKAHQAALDQFGPAEMGPVGRLAMRLVRFFTGRSSAIPQPKVAVIDTGIDVNHPMLKGVKLKNETTGENIDDIGHGSWVTADVLNIGRWLKDVTHYKTFSNGGATLEDILKSLTDAGNDGNIIMSNSWGSDEGDPDSPDSQLVRKLAEEGRIMVFAAGNSGYSGKNTIGSPAIVYYKDAKTGAVRVLSVAASDRKKRIAPFSSRGPRSEKTKDDPSYPTRPDLTSVGHNKESAWPTNLLSEADRTDPVYGPVKAISGTSMSTPDIAGAIAHLAQLFGVTEVGERLDAVVNAVMSTLEKTGQGHDNEGDGFIDMDAAYDLLKKTMEPATSGFIARAAARAARWFAGLMG